MSNVWSILGIEPTQDKTSIKRAYSKLLKIHHPEDDPEGYQRLREAYDRALKLADQISRSQLEEDDDEDEWENEYDEDDEENDDDDVEDDESDYEDDDDEEQERRIPRLTNWQFQQVEDEPDEESQEEHEEHEEEEGSEYEILESFHAMGGEDHKLDLDQQAANFDMELEELYEDYASRIVPDNWLELLNSDLLWNITYKKQITSDILDFLEENYLLPRAVWDAIESVFMWRAMDVHEREEFSDEYPNVYAYIFEGFAAQNFDYSILLDKKELDYDAYLLIRLEAYQALIDNDLQTAGQMLNRAAYLFDHDPSVLRMQADYFYRMGDRAKALAVYGQLLELAPNDRDIRLTRARFRIEAGETKAALDDANYVLKHNPNDTDALSFAGQCLVKLGEWEKAKELLERLLSINPNDINGIIDMAAVHAHYADKGQKSVDRNERKRLLRELDRKPLGVRARRAFFGFVRENYIKFILIAILHVFPLLFFQKIGYTPIEYIKANNQPVEVQTVTTLAELQEAYSIGDNISVTVTDARYLAIIELIESNKNKDKPFKYVTAKEAEDLLTSSSGYICIGKIGDVSIIISATYKQAKEIYDNKTITIEGRPLALNDEELLAHMENWAKYEGNDKYIADYPLADLYLSANDVGREKLQKQNDVPSLPFWMAFIALFLLLFYVNIAKHIRRYWRYFMYM